MFPSFLWDITRYTIRAIKEEYQRCIIVIIQGRRRNDIACSCGSGLWIVITKFAGGIYDVWGDRALCHVMSAVFW